MAVTFCPNGMKKLHKTFISHRGELHKCGYSSHVGKILHITVIQNVTFNETLFYKKGFVNDSSANCVRASLYDSFAAHACLRVQDVYNSHIW